jgi:hypothetical protein
MQRIVLTLALALALALPARVDAAPAPQTCGAGMFEQVDMAGTYLSDEIRLRVRVYPCGGTTVLWDDGSGLRQASYLGQERVPGGGYMARLTVPDPVARSLDGRNVILVKPAEAGLVQLVTASQFGDDIRVYRLYKLDLP